MTLSRTTRIGNGKSPFVLKGFQCKWPGLDVIFRSDDIRQPAACQIHDHNRRHAVVVHPLAGVRGEFLHQAVRESMSVADGGSEMLAESLSRAICPHFCHASSPGGHGYAKPSSDTFPNAAISRRLREFIFENLCERIRRAELSTRSDLTTHPLLIEFRKAFGSTFGQYVIQQRLRCAQRQQGEAKRDIISIVLDSGVASHSHLAARFRQHLGCCPRTFRKGIAAVPQLVSKSLSVFLPNP